jgi:TRAP-type mannitol/chloroaromatic compound transport system permease small subunit
MLTFIRIVERLSGGFGLIAAGIVAPLILATVYEVFSRYLFNAPTIWAYELAYMAMGTNFLLGAAFTLRERGHIRIDLLYGHMSTRMRALIDSIGYAFLFLPVSWWLSWGLWNYAYDALLSGETSGESAWNPIIWPFRMVFFIGLLLISLQATAELIKSVSMFFGRDLTKDAK